MNNSTKTKKYCIADKRAKGFSLVEIITVLTVVSLVTIAAFTMFNRVKSAAASINDRLDINVLPTEILQRIAEDLDRLTSAGLDTNILIRDRFDSGYATTQMVIENLIYDGRNKPKSFEKITWQSQYDSFEDALILYRSHGGA